jgi:hypothetical protein
MSIRIDKTTLQFEIKPNYDAQQLNKLKDDLTDANKKLDELIDERKSLVKPKKSDKEAWAQYQKDLLNVTMRINEQKTVVDRATKAVEAQREKMGLAGLTLRELQQELKRYNAIMANIQPGTEGFIKTRQHIDDIKKRIDELKGKLSFEVKDTSNSLMKFAKEWNHIGFAITNAFEIKDRIAGFISSVRSTLDPMAEMAREAEGVELAFDRINRPDMLDQLRQATHGTVTDIELMKQAVKFKDFNLPVEQLGTYLAFAQQKAKDTGESIDNMVTSIVNGLGRQSPQILDNLGLSAKQISEEAKRSGNFFDAVAKIVKENMAEAGEYVETSSERAAQATTKLKNAQADLGREWLPIMERLDTTYNEFQISLIQIVKWMLQHRSAILSVTEALASLIGVYAVYVGWKERELLITKLSTVARLKDLAAMKLHTAATAASTIVTKAWQTATVLATATTTLFTRGLGAMRMQMALARMEGMALSASGIGALITVLSVVGVAIYSVVKALKTETEETNKATEAQRELADAEKEGTKSAASETARLRQLYQATQDTNKSMDERLAAVKKIKAEYPAYFGQLSNEAILAGQASDAYRQLTTDILAAAKARAYQGRIDKLEESNIDIEEQINEGQKWLDENKARFERSVRAANITKPSDQEQLANLAAGEAGVATDKQMAQAFVALYKQRRSENMALRQQHLTNTSTQDQYAEKVAQAQLSVDRLNANNTTSTTTTTSNTKGGNGENKEIEEARKRMKEQEELAKAERQKADLEAKQQYQRNLLTEEEYHAARYQNETAYIARIQQIRDNAYATEAEKQEVQNMAIDSLINEANYQREQKQKNLQQTLAMMEQSYQADQIALEQQRLNGEFATEEEYNRKKIEAEIDYQTERLRIIREAGGDTLEAEMALQRALMQQTKEAQAQRLTELKKQSDIADLQHDYDQQLAIQQQMLDEKLISQQQYEQNVTDIVTAAEQDRQSIRESYAQAAQQLMSATSSLFSAMQSREEARVDKKYKTLIDRAKKNGKDTSKLEEQQEEEKNAIRKKYADKQFAMTVLQIIANTASGISKIWAEWGWNPPVATGLTATEVAVGAVQLATAKAQRDQAAGLYTGGYSDEVEGFTADGNPRDVAGMIPVHKKEFVINHEALKIPAIRKVADVIDSAQKRKSYNIENTTRILQETIFSHQGLASGGYSSAPLPTEPPLSVPSTDPRIIESVERNTQMLQQLLDEGITILRLRKEIKHEEQLERNARR